MKLTPIESFLLSILYMSIATVIILSYCSKKYQQRNYHIESITGGAHQHHDYQFDIRNDTFFLFDEHRLVNQFKDTTIWHTALGESIVEDQHNPINN